MKKGVKTLFLERPSSQFGQKVLRGPFQLCLNSRAIALIFFIETQHKRKDQPDQIIILIDTVEAA
jgi:hypothetical protein